MNRAVVAIAAALALGGCAAVFVHTDGQPVRVSFGPWPARIDAGANPAIAIRELNVGVYRSCLSAGVGVQACEEFRIDAAACGLGLIELRPAAIAAPTGPRPKHAAARVAALPGDLFATIADQVRAECPHATPKGATP